MSTAGAFLERIVAARRAHVAQAAARRPQAELERALAGGRAPARGFEAALCAAPPGRLAVIAEVKRASPSAGTLRAAADPAQLAAAYARGGAAALSVLTEPDFFAAEPGDLERARAVTGLPVLRKDFVVDPWQLAESALLGADAVLLLVVILGAETGRYVARAMELGLEPFVEVHTTAEMEMALATPARVIGINNRDLRSFTVDTGTAARLAPLARGRTVAALSGIRGPADVRGLAAAGIRAVLVGEALVRAGDPEAAVRALAGAEA